MLAKAAIQSCHILTHSENSLATLSSITTCNGGFTSRTSMLSVISSGQTVTYGLKQERRACLLVSRQTRQPWRARVRCLNFTGDGSSKKHNGKRRILQNGEREATMLSSMPPASSGATCKAGSRIASSSDDLILDLCVHWELSVINVVYGIA